MSLSKNEKLEVTIKYNEFKQTISGSPEVVTREYFNVLSKVIPAFGLALELVARPSIAEMAGKLKGLVHLYGPHVIIMKTNLNVEDSVLLALVSKYIGFGIKATTEDSMTLQEIVETTGKPKRNVLNVLHRLMSTKGVDQLSEDRFRISDWKAHEYILRKIPDVKPIKITDFATKKEKTFGHNSVMFTIGYEGRDLSQFLRSLKDDGIEVLVDVRKDAYSKRDRNFNEGILAKMAASVQIKYIHLPELGVEYAQRQELKSNHDYETYFKLYFDYLDKNPHLISFLADLSKNNRVCLMCYEKDFKRCHRMILADRLEKLGMIFHHIV